MPKCLRCGKELTGKTSRAKFCNCNCKRRFYYNSKQEKECLCCGKKFIGTEGIKYCSKECRDKGMIENLTESMITIHGKAHALQVKEIKEKQELSTEKTTGHKHALQSKKYLDKARAKTKETTGYEYAMQSEEIKDKVKKKRKEKTGQDNPMKLLSVQEKAKATYKEKTGYEFPAQNPETMAKIVETNLKNKGVPYYCMTDECRSAGSSNSKENIKLREFLRNRGIQGIEDDKELSLEGYSYDIPIGQILIENDPWPCHNLTRDKYDKTIAINCKRLEELQRKTREKTITEEEEEEKKEILERRKNVENYHKDKTICARQHGFRCIHIFDWDDREKIVYLLDDNKQKIYARKCKVRQITYEEAHPLFEAYHLQGDTAKNKNNVYIGLIYEGNLIMAISFGKPRYKKDYEREILRLCTHKDYSVIGGASKIFKYFVQIVDPNSVVSYCDMAKFDGKVYEQMGLDLLVWNHPSRRWRFTGITRPEKKKLEDELGYEIFLPDRKHMFFTDNFINNARGFDQLLGKFFGKFGDKGRNVELLRKFNYVEVYDCGQATYIRHKEKEEK